MEAGLKAASLAGDLGALLQLLQEDGLLLDKLCTIPHPSNNPLHIAALRGHANFASEILSRKPELAKDLNEQGFSPLHLASANGHLSVVKELLKVDLDLCLIRDKDGLMPIHSAVIKGKICVVKELIHARPEAAKAATCQGETVAHLAVKSNRFEALEFLVEKLGGDDELLNSKDEKGNTILHLAVARKQLQILKFLLSQPEIQVNTLNLKGFTPLDVLLESPSEHGDLVLGEMIRAAGGKKAEEASPPEAQSRPIQRVRTSPTRSNWIGRLRHFFCPGHRTKTSRRDLQAERENGNTSGTLMVVATLIATVTFQAGMNPPGGFVSSDGHQSSESDDDLAPGHAVLGPDLSTFLVFDIMGLFLALSIILLLICVVPRKKRVLTKFLKWVMWFSVFCTAFAFASAIRQIFPFSLSTPIAIFLLGWCVFFAFAMNWLFIRLSFCLLRKAGCLEKGIFIMDQRNIRRIRVGTAVKRIVFIVVVVVAVCFIDWMIVPRAMYFSWEIGK